MTELDREKALQRREAANNFWGSLDGPTLNGVVDDVWNERARQLDKWGVQERPTGVNAREYKPLEDMARARYEQNLANGSLTWADILKEEFYEALAEEDVAKQRVELVQVMAVAASWILDLDRRHIPEAERAAALEASRLRSVPGKFPTGHQVTGPLSA